MTVVTTMTPAQMREHTAVKPGGSQIDTFTLYDKLPFVDNTTSELTFFAEKVGTNSKTYQHTNLEANGSLPAGNTMVVHAVEVLIIPGKTGAGILKPSLTAGAQAAAGIVNDEYLLRTTGVLEIYVDGILKLRDGPLLKFPSSGQMEVTGAISDVTTAGAALQSRHLLARCIGAPYRIRAISLKPNQSFKVMIRWPDGAVDLSADCHIQVSLVGELNH
jgi:hypothetical protein